MAGSTISTPVYHGITLGTPNYYSPLTITNTGAVEPSDGIAVYSALAGASLENAGTITGAGAGNGVALNAGGNLTNDTGGVIQGYDGVYVRTAAGTVANDGTITGAGIGGVGVSLYGGGSATNGTGGLIHGNDAGVAVYSGTAGTVGNSGTITGGNAGVYLGGGGSVTNGLGGVIQSSNVGVSVRYGGGTVTNDGTITASGGGFGGDGVYLHAGGIVTNGTGGLIEGGYRAVVVGDAIGTVINYGTITGSVSDGVHLGAGGTATNSGAISGGYGTAVSFGGNGDNRLILDARYSFGGVVYGGAGAVNTLELASSSNTGTVSTSFVTEFVNFGTIVVDSSASWTISCDNTLASGGVLINLGTLTDLGNLTNYGLISGSGTLIVDPATLTNSGSIGLTVTLSGGTYLDNTLTGTISAAGDGVYGIGGTATVSNSGTITGASAANGVALNVGGTVTNYTGGLIQGYNGIYVKNAGGTVANYGTITGTTGDGVYLYRGGIVTNGTDGLIQSNRGREAVRVYGDVGTVINSGTIIGNNAGVYLGGDGSVTNGIDGVIHARNRGVYFFKTAGTVTNDGTITATGGSMGGDGVYLKAGGIITNGTAGLIQSDNRAIIISGTVATVINYGRIISTGGRGVELDDGGNVTNGIGGLIQGYNRGVVRGYGTVITVDNYGTISGGNEGVYLFAGGSVTNGIGGLIESNYYGVEVGSGDVMVTNDGTITAGGLQSYGIVLKAGGIITNDAAGLVRSDNHAVVVAGAVGTVINYGAITGTGGDGVQLNNGGTVSNAVDGLIQGNNRGVAVFYPAAGIVTNAGTITGTTGSGIDFAAGGTVADSGTITGGSGTAIDFGGTGGNLLVLEHGYALNGGVSVGGSGNTLELLGAAGAVTVDLNGPVSGLTNFATVKFSVASGSDLTLRIDGTVMPSNTIAGFGTAHDFVDLRGIAFDQASHGDLIANNVLQVSANSATYDLQLDPARDFTGDFFHTGTDSSTGTLLFENETPCFCRGTMILTDRGQVPVEALKVGDNVMTIAGEAKPIVWIGHGRRVLTGNNPEARPLIVRAHAIADGVPRRDLYLTRGHSLYIDEVLIPVEFLVNERSILWDEGASEVEFYHVELEDHDVLLAEGAPTESYRDDGNRQLFDNSEPPVFAAANMTYFAPVLMGGPEVDRIWRELLDRSGFEPPEATDDPDLHLVADGERIDPAAIEFPQHHYQGIYRFRLERAPKALAIVSRHMRPMAMGINHDPRRVGVAIRSIGLRGNGTAIDLDYDSPCLVDGGFNGPEPEARQCWTTGCAPLPRGCHRLIDGPLEVLLDVVCTAKYPLADGARDADRAAAA